MDNAKLEDWDRMMADVFDLFPELQRVEIRAVRVHHRIAYRAEFRFSPLWRGGQVHTVDALTHARLAADINALFKRLARFA